MISKNKSVISVNLFFNPSLSVIISMVFAVVIGVGVLGGGAQVQAADYYMATDGSDTTGDGSSGNEWQTLQYSMAHMLGGDTLIIRDGIYTGTENVVDTNHFPPQGTNTNWTIIKAEHDGKVFFGDPDSISTDRTFYVENKGDSYIQFEGLVWFGGCVVGAVNYLKFLRCGSGNNIVNNVGMLFRNSVSHHILYEDCYAWGGGRYRLLSYKSDYIIVRRFVGRIDATNTEHDGRLEPLGGVAFYDSSNCEGQNIIIIDSDTGDYWNVASLVGAFTLPNGGGTGNFFRGCINLHGDMSLHGQSVGFSDTNRMDCIGWDAPSGALLGYGTTYDHLTIGNISTWLSYGAVDGHTGNACTVQNSLFVNISAEYGALKNVALSDYNYFYGNYLDYFNTNQGVHDVININPMTNSLKYLPRIEANSDLSSKASDGGDIGATVMKRIGISGTLWGEPGYNETTTESLWPFPNEDIIKTNMKTYLHPQISGERGFCANGTGLYGGNITLTSYIWEYLGNPCPDEICNYTTPNSNTLQDFEDEILWLPGGSQDTGGYGRGWGFTWPGAGDMIEIDNIGANGTNHSLKLTFASENNNQIYFRSNDKTTDHMPEADGANRMSFYVRFPADFPIQPLPFRYDTWQLGTYIHDPNNWLDIHGATDWDDHGIHHYYARLTTEQVGDGWVKYIINTQPDQCNYGGSTVPPNITHFFDEFGRFYFHFGEAAGGPNPTKPYTIWIDEIKFYHDDGFVGGQVHTGGLDDDGFDGEWFSDDSDTTSPSRSNPQPTETIASGTTQTTISLTTNETATCKYSATAGASYTNMTQFTNTTGTNHTTEVTGLKNGLTYNYYVKCKDASENTNTDDYAITFSVASTQGTNNSTSSKGGGKCFIATAAYGTPLAEEVKVLSRFRDNHLLTNYCGKIFVKLYCKYSPKIAECISQKPWLKRVIRLVLRPLVNLISPVSARTRMIGK